MREQHEGAPDPNWKKVPTKPGDPPIASSVVVWKDATASVMRPSQASSEHEIPAQQDEEFERMKHAGEGTNFHKAYMLVPPAAHGPPPRIW